MTVYVTPLAAPTINYVGYRLFSDGHTEYTSGTWTNVDTISGNNITRHNETLVLRIRDEHQDHWPAAIAFTSIYDPVSYDDDLVLYHLQKRAGREAFIGLKQSFDQNKANVFYTFSGKSPSTTDSNVGFRYSGEVPSVVSVATTSGQLDTSHYYDGVPLFLTTNLTGEYNIITCAVYYNGRWSTENKAHVKIVLD